MSRITVLLLAVLAWVAVVAMASGVTWWVINAAGQQVLAGGELPAEVQSPATASPTHAVPPSAPATPTIPGPAPSQQRTWEGSAGSVTVRCSGLGASLQSASPDDGYGVEVGAHMHYGESADTIVTMVVAAVACGGGWALAAALMDRGVEIADGEPAGDERPDMMSPPIAHTTDDDGHPDQPRSVADQDLPTGATPRNERIIAPDTEPESAPIPSTSTRHRNPTSPPRALLPRRCPSRRQGGRRVAAPHG